MNPLKRFKTTIQVGIKRMLQLQRDIPNTSQTEIAEAALGVYAAIKNEEASGGQICVKRKNEPATPLETLG